MSNLPGNPHHDVADSLKNEYPLTADKEALNWPLAEINERLAALAYEQRTANLIAVATVVSEDGVYQLDPALLGAAQEQIANRLGLGDK